MAHIYLHIGLNKTGTSSLQDFLRMNAPALGDEGVCYPQAGRDAAAHHPLSKWLKSPKGIELGAGAPMVSALLEEIRDADKVVLSSEDFHTHGPKSIEHLARLFAGHEVSVVLYVREHVAYLASWYQQNVQATHLSCAFDSFCYFTRKPLARIADQWVREFGRDRVMVGLYDRAHLIQGDVVQDFAARIGLMGDLRRFKRKPYESNPSVAGNLLFIKRLVNNFHSKAVAASFVDEVTALSRLKPEFQGAMQVDAEAVAYVAGMYKGDRQELHQRYGLRIEAPSGVFPGRLTPDFETLQQDWALVMATARERGFALAESAELLQLADCRRLVATAA
ncbi:MAG TPA: hypothetical protein VGQ91_07725 [Ideonella sp.]|jgi:hypothetical protein|nr:hypothetical protein [Ideonella sp.]